GFQALGWRLADDFFEFAGFGAVGVEGGDDAVFDEALLPILAEQIDRAIGRALAFALDLVGFIPAVAWEPATVTDAVELAVAEGDDLDSKFLIGDFAGVFALEGEVGIFGGLGGGDVGGVF